MSNSLQLNDLTKVTGEAAHAAGLLSDDQIESVCLLQAAAIELLKVHPELGDLSRASEKDLLGYIAEAKISKDAVYATAATLKPSGRVPDGVPRFGDLLDKKGYLPKKKSNPLLAAQAAARMAEQVEKMAKGTVEGNLEAVLKPRPWIEAGKDKGEPEYATAAQATNHLAEIFAAGLANNPQLAQDADIRRAMMAFQIYASQTLKRAGSELEQVGEKEAGKAMKDAREPLHGVSRVGIFSEYANTSSLVEDMQKGLSKLGLPAEAKQMIGQRLQQAKGMEHKGLPMPAFLRSTRDVDVGGWAKRVSNNARGNNGISV